MSTSLAEIINLTRMQVERDKRVRPLDQLLAGDLVQCRPFCEAIKQGDRPRIIAECKYGSPVSGPYRLTYDPAKIAADYVAAGACAVSVVTNRSFGGYGVVDLREVRAGAAGVPVLCKDFILDRYQLHQAKSALADAVLLIAMLHDRPTLESLVAETRALKMVPVVEVHTYDDVATALYAGAKTVLINNRDLRTMELQMATVEKLLDQVDRFAATIIAASGYACRADMNHDTRVSAYLVGEHLLRHGDPGQALKNLIAGYEEF